MNVIPFRTRNNKPERWVIVIEPGEYEEIQIKGNTIYIITYDIDRLEELKKKAVALYRHKSKEVQGV